MNCNKYRLATKKDFSVRKSPFFMTIKSTEDVELNKQSGEK